MDTADSPRPGHELARLTELPPALRMPPPPASQPSSSGGGGLPINPRLVLRGLARHWWQALALWVVGTAALAALVYLQYQPTYRASSLLRVETDSDNPYETGRGDPMARTELQTQMQLITSPNVLTTVASDSTVASLIPRSELDSEAYLREIIKVSPRTGSLIEVSAETPQPQAAPKIVNEVVKAFLNEDAQWAKARNSTSIERLEQYRRDLEADIEGKRGTLLELVKESENPDMIQPGNLRALLDEGGRLTTSAEDSGLEVELSEYQKLHQELLQLEYEELEAQAELDTVRRQAAATDPRVWVERRIEQVFLADENVRGLREALKDIQVQIDEAQSRIRNPADPAVSRLKIQQQRLMERYNQLWGDLEPALRAQLAAEEDNPTQLVRQAEARLTALEQRRELMKDRLDRIKMSERSKGEDQLEMSFASTDLNQRRAMLQQVERRLEELEFESLGANPIIVISEAEKSIQTTNKRDKYLAFTPLAMLGLVLGLVTLVEMRSGRVAGTEDLTGRLSAEIFAVPPLPTARSSNRKHLEGPGQDPKFEQFVQQLDHLRVALCGEGGNEGRGRCVLITSAVGGEGKTTLAAQLAVRCAEAGASTVLIDSDLRRATLGRLFEIPDCPGLSDVLRGDAQLEDALVPISQVGGCQLLPAGSPEANPNRILRGKNFAPMLERLRRSFDVVIIDTSPVLPVPDALILGRLTDGAVIATRHDQSRFPAVERANGLLTGAGVPVLGVVVNGARSVDRRFGAGYAAYTYRSDRVPSPADDPSVG